jgi:hypothetical protein
MPVLERRKILKMKEGSYRMNPPKDWAEFFGLRGGEELDTIADAPWVVFPPSVKSREDRIAALQKIIALIEATPERPFPEAKRGKKK